MYEDDNSESNISIYSEFTRTINTKVLAEFNKAYTLTDYNIHNSLDERYDILYISFFSLGPMITRKPQSN